MSRKNYIKWYLDFWPAIRCLFLERYGDKQMHKRTTRQGKKNILLRKLLTLANPHKSLIPCGNTVKQLH